MHWRKFIILAVATLGSFQSSCSGNGAGMSGMAKKAGKSGVSSKDQGATGGIQPSMPTAPAPMKEPGSGATKVDDADDDVRVVPPEVVSGAYLTCERVTSIKDPAPDSEAYFGCQTVTDASGGHKRVKLKGTNSKFTLRDSHGAVLDIPPTTVNDPDVDVDVAWRVKTSVLDAGLAADVDIPGADPSTVTKKTCSKVTNINGKFYRCNGA